MINIIKKIDISKIIILLLLHILFISFIIFYYKNDYKINIFYHGLIYGEINLNKKTGKIHFKFKNIGIYNIIDIQIIKLYDPYFTIYLCGHKANVSCKLNTKTIFKGLIMENNTRINQIIHDSKNKYFPYYLEVLTENHYITQNKLIF